MASKAQRQSTSSRGGRSGGRNGAVARNRYVISTVVGGKINPGAGTGTTGKPPVGCEVSILDRDQCYKQIWVRSTPAGSMSTGEMMVMARKRCAAMNAEERRWERVGA